MTALQVSVRIRQVRAGSGYRIIRRTRIYRQPTLWQRVLGFFVQGFPVRDFFVQTPEAILARQQRMQALQAQQDRCVLNQAGQLVYLPALTPDRTREKW